MRIAVIANSATGNTAQVADAVASALREAAEVEEVRLAADTAEAAQAAVAAADAVALGFWCDKGTCSEAVDALMPSLSGKRVFLFGTAGFGADASYFERILAGVAEKLPEGAAYVGGAMCQGKMGTGVRRRYEAMLEKNPEDARIQAMIANFDAALAHPDADDCTRIAAAAEALLA